MNTAAQELTVRGGFEFVCEATAWTPAILKIQPRLDPWQRKEKEQMASFPYLSVEMAMNSPRNSSSGRTLRWPQDSSKSL